MDRKRPSVPSTSPAESIIGPALKLGALSGTAGFITGGVAGVIKDSPALLFATASGIQWFGLGTTFWGTRSLIFQAWDSGKGVPLSKGEKTSASIIAGGVAGSGVGLLSRGPRNVIPGGIMFSLFGFLGQTVANSFDNTAEQAPDKQNFWQKFANLKWSPVSVLSDEDYEKMLLEKQLRVEAELAIVDERIADLRKQATQMVAKEKAAS